MNWKYIKWLLKQPKVKVIHKSPSLWMGYWDSYEIHIKGKLMHKHYKHPDHQGEIRYNWIERL